MAIETIFKRPIYSHYLMLQNNIRMAEEPVKDKIVQIVKPAYNSKLVNWHSISMKEHYLTACQW